MSSRVLKVGQLRSLPSPERVRASRSALCRARIPLYAQPAKAHAALLDGPV
ncbi:hypothetical protein [Nitrospira sp.]|uniref:hypothetical protein n=1 Tax=Nitrospira sp. TaxID=70125 RepID=UPI003FCC8EEE